LIHIAEERFQWVYSATAFTALLMVLLLPSSSKTVAPTARRSYWVLQALTLVGAAVGAKLAFLAGDLAWPSSPVTWEEVIFSGRSITGGLLGGLLTAELAKLPLHYTQLPNDWFAAKLPLSVGVGRVGCLLAGCCRGVPTTSDWSLVYSDGIPRFPAQAWELGFQLLAFAVCFALYRKQLLKGRVFATYLVAYGLFRAVIEGLRDTRKLESGWSVYQWLALAVVFCGALSFAWYSRARLEGGDATRT
jgi:prolipoprotein diacylglyceryltransferase